MKFIKQAVKSLDLFGFPILLEYKGRRFFKSVIGGLTTLLILVIILVFLVKSFQQILSRSKVSYTRQWQRELEKPVTFNQNNFFFMAGLYGVNLITNPFNLTLDISSIHRQQSVNNYKSFQIRPCSYSVVSSFFKQLSKQQYQELKIDQWVCAPAEFTFNASGLYSSKIFQYFKFSIACSKDKCVRQELPSLDLSFYFSNFIINPLSPFEPAQMYLEDKIHFAIDPKTISHSSNLYFAQNIIKEQVGFIVSEFKQSQFIVFEQKQESLISHDFYIYRLYIRLHPNHFKHIRTFVQISEQISFIGGLFSFLFFIGQLFALKFNQFKFKVSLSNQLFKHSHGSLIRQFECKLGERWEECLSQNQNIDRKLVRLLLKDKRLDAGLTDFLMYKLTNSFLNCFSFQSAESHYLKLCMITIRRELDIRHIFANSKVLHNGFDILFLEEQTAVLNLIKEACLLQQTQKQERLTQGAFRDKVINFLQSRNHQENKTESLRGIFKTKIIPSDANLNPLMFERLINNYNKLKARQDPVSSQIIEQLHSHPFYGKVFKGREEEEEEETELVIKLRKNFTNRL